MASATVLRSAAAARRRRFSLSCLLATGLVFAASSQASTLAHPRAFACQTWAQTTLISGAGVLESLEFDDRGGMLIANNGDNAIQRLTPDGKLTTLLAPVTSPGAFVVRGRALYFNTGDDLQSGVGNIADGTLD